MPPKTLPADQMLTARVSHLNMIQGVVSRLATFSANAKNFCITVVAALLGIAFQQHLRLLLLTAALVVVSFAALDSYYLAQERRFRDFYRDVVDRPLAGATELGLTPPKLKAWDYFAGIVSFTTGGFYSLLLIVGIALLPIIHDGPQENGLGNTGGAAVRRNASIVAESQPIRKPEQPRIDAQRLVQNTAAVAADRRDVRQPVSAVRSHR